jgi:catechol 2,3-dioxygenase-like lactoylglutathione lyase family enzyme
MQTHVSLDTTDLPASVAFYRALLGEGPAVERHDYARFDVAEPALVLGLNAVASAVVPAASGAESPATPPAETGVAAGGSTRAAASGALEHLGILYAGDAQLDAARQRLAGLGAALDEEPDTECCYARLARVWATDPSGVRWELFVVREAFVDAPSRAGRSRDGGAGAATPCCEPTCCARIGA